MGLFLIEEVKDSGVCDFPKAQCVIIHGVQVPGYEAEDTQDIMVVQEGRSCAERVGGGDLPRNKNVVELGKGLEVVVSIV